MMAIATGRMLSLYIYPGDLADITHQDISRCSVIPEKAPNISKYLIIDRSNIEYCGDIQIAICQVLDYQLIIGCQ